jgi:hypothetical protein
MVWVVFFFTVVYSMFGHILLYFFEEKRKQLSVEFKEDASDITDAEISSHSVLLRGINRSLPLNWVKEVLTILFIKSNTDKKSDQIDILTQELLVKVVPEKRKKKIL